jgi:hypothetical protein
VIILHNSVTGWNVSTATIKSWGYNLIIRRSGEVIKGQGNAHTYGHNDKFGVCMIGNYEKEQPTQAQIDSLIRIMRNRNDFNLKGHKDFANNPPGRNITACPGRNLYKLIPRIREEAMENYKAQLKKCNYYRERRVKDVKRLTEANKKLEEEIKDLKHHIAKVADCQKELEKYEREHKVDLETNKALLEDNKALSERLKASQGLEEASVWELIKAILTKIKKND